MASLFGLSVNGYCTALGGSSPAAAAAAAASSATFRAEEVTWASSHTWLSTSGTKYLGPLAAPNGTAGAPGYGFSADAGEGMYVPSANTLGLTAGGALRLSMNSTSIAFNQIAQVINGSVTDPSIGGTGANTDTGFMWSDTDLLRVTNAGAESFRWTSGGQTYITGTVTAASTMTVKGAAFSVGGSTLTVATSGIVTAASQPSVLVARNVSVQSIPDVQMVDIYWQTVQHDRNGMFDATSASNTLTARGAGIYLVHCGVSFAASVTGTIRTVRIITGSTYVDTNDSGVGNNVITVENTTVLSLADGAGVKCRAYQDSSAGLNIGNTDTDSYNTSFSMTKLW